MKKSIISLFMIVSVIISTILPSNATENNITNIDESTTITYYDDGSYIVRTIISNPSNNRTSSFTKTGNVVVSDYNSDDELLWQYILYAEFEVTSGVSAICTSSTYTYDIYANGWSFSNGQATKSGNVAYGVGTFKKKILLITTQTVEIDLDIICDLYGNLS